MILLIKNVIKLNDKGFTLIEILVAFGVSALLLAALTGFIQSMYVNEGNLRAQREFDDLVDRVFLFLRKESNCRNNLLNTHLQLGQTNNVTISEFDQSANNVGIVAQPGLQINNLIQVTSVTLSTDVQLGTNRWLTYINISADPLRQQGQTLNLKYSIPVYATSDQLSNLIECYSKLSLGGDALNQTVCSLGLGGDYYYDPVTQKCKNRYVTACFSGTKDAARCGPGSIKLDSDTYHSCQSTVTDTSTVSFPRTYVDGTVRSSDMPRAYQCVPDSDNLGVQCIYATDVDSSSAICSACCTVDLLQNPSATTLPQAILSD